MKLRRGITDIFDDTVMTETIDIERVENHGGITATFLLGSQALNGANEE